jgi:predicted deacylase
MAALSVENIPVRKLASGEILQLSVYRFQGSKGGPSAYLQASLHGSETQGNWVIAELLERLSVLEILGDITLVPCANPFAQNHKIGDYTLGRFDPVDGDNWNRTFEDLSGIAVQVAPEWPQAKEKMRALMDSRLSALLAGNLPHAKSLALTLQRMAAGHDFLLDLHCATLCETYAYVPAYAFSSFSDLPCRHALRIGPDFGGAMDEAFFVPWWRLGERIKEATGAFPALPEGFTLELGEQNRNDPELAAEQAEGILHFLAKRGVVAGNFRKMAFPSRYAGDLKNFRTVFSPTGGFVKLKARLGEIAEQGAPYCEFLGFQPFLRETMPCSERSVPITFTNASSVHQGTELGKYLTDFFPVEK